MKLSLNRLHKFKATLSAEVSSTRLDLKRFYTVSLVDDVYHSVSVANTFMEEQEKKVNKYTDLSDDLAKLNSAIFKANVESGLNDILNKLPSVKAMLNFFKSWKNTALTAEWGLSSNTNPMYILNSTTAARLTEIKACNNNGNVDLEFVTETQVQNRIVKLNKLKRELEDGQDKINSEYMVEIDFTDATKEVLGL